MLSILSSLNQNNGKWEDSNMSHTPMSICHTLQCKHKQILIMISSENFEDEKKRRIERENMINLVLPQD